MTDLFKEANTLVSLDSGCMSCSQYFTCKDPDKGVAFVCKKYFPIAKAHPDDLLVQAQAHIDYESSVYKEFRDDEEEIQTFESMIQEALKQNRFLPQDLSIDDSDFKEATNYFDWTYGSKYIRFRPFARQMWIALRLFSEVCPYCSNPKWYNDIEEVPVDFNTANIQEHLTLLEYGVCPSCKRGRAAMFKANKLDIYQELAACVGQRGGKSSQIAALISYHLHKLLKTVRPSEFYGLASSTTLTHTCTALQFKRAYSLLWTPTRDTISDSSWFSSYHAFLKERGERMGQELFVVKDTFINWKRARLMAAPAAPNIGTLRGDTRVGGAIDELGFFRFGSGSEDYVTISADEIHASISNSLATIRTAAANMIRRGEDNVMQGMMFNISSPSSVFDKIMTLVRASRSSRVILGVHLPTWGMNPLVTREDLQIYWDTNATKAERDFGANPPLADNPFFGNPEVIAKMFTGTRNRVNYKLVENPKNQYERAAKLQDLMPLGKMPPSLMTLDAGEVNNSFSLSISIPVLRGQTADRPKPNSQGFASLVRVDSRGVSKPKVLAPQREVNLNTDQGLNHRCVVLGCLEVMPATGGRINFNQMFKKVIVPLLQPFNVQAVVTDRWNSILMLDQLYDDHGVATFQYSLRYSDFVAIRSYMEGDMVQLPRTESEEFTSIATFDETGYPYCFEHRPIDHLALQLQTVQDGQRTVTKGPNLTDDTFRTIALAVHYLRNTEFVKQYLSGGIRNSGRGGGLVAAPGSADNNGSLATVSMTGYSNKALIAVGNGSGEAGTTFARSKR